MSTWKLAAMGLSVCFVSACAPELRTFDGAGGASASSSSSSGTAGAGGQAGSSSASSSSSSSSVSSSSSGGGGSGPIGTIGQPCPMVGMLGCAGNAQKSQIICSENLTWQTNGTCGPILLCDTSPGVNQGTCQPIISDCQGEAPGTIVCDGKDRVECGPDLVTTTFVETCSTLCNEGTCSVCVTGQSQCVGNFVRSCNILGEWQPAVPCPKQLPVCIADACADPTSCQGLPKTCGPQGDESCCSSILVSGGTFNRANNPSYPATVSDYRLDKYEVTVGRFRKFFDGYPANKPIAGLGAQSNIAGSGWDPAWDANLPSNQTALQTTIQCTTYPSWTPTAGANENKPIGCADWYLMFAFCAWDGGYLPTEAQWNYAAAGGNDQRVYPWGAAIPDASYATFDCNGAGTSGVCSAADLLNVGSFSPKGDGKFGHSDLAGGMYEWMLDKYASTYTIANCTDCADLVSGSSRVIRGGDWKSTASSLPNTGRAPAGALFHQDNIAARCARRP